MELRLKKVSKFNSVIKIQQLRRVIIQRKIHWKLTPGRYSIRGSKYRHRTDDELNKAAMWSSANNTNKRLIFLKFDYRKYSNILLFLLPLRFNASQNATNSSHEAPCPARDLFPWLNTRVKKMVRNGLKKWKIREYPKRHSSYLSDSGDTFLPLLLKHDSRHNFLAKCEIRIIMIHIFVDFMQHQSLMPLIIVSNVYHWRKLYTSLFAKCIKIVEPIFCPQAMSSRGMPLMKHALLHPASLNGVRLLPDQRQLEDAINKQILLIDRSSFLSKGIYPSTLYTGPFISPYTLTIFKCNNSAL